MLTQPKERYSIGKDKATELYESFWWENKTDKEICDVQLFTKELCMHFSTFHRSMEKVLNRPIWTHEFAFIDNIVNEYLGNKPSPTMEEITLLLHK